MRRSLPPLSLTSAWAACRPHLALLRTALAATGLAAVLSAAPPAAGLAGLRTSLLGPHSVHATGIDVAVAELQFLDLINADRAAAGVPPVQADSRLMELARWRSEDMLARNYLSHDIGGFNVVNVLRERQIPFKLAGENICVNTFGEAETVKMAQVSLMRSAEHRDVILKPEFNLVGVGIATSADRRAVYTQIFVQG